MQEINLLQNESQGNEPFSFNFRKRGPVFFYFVLILLLLELGFYAFLFFSNRQITRQAQTVQQKTADIELEIGKVDKERKDAISVQSRLKNLDTLLEGHLFWSKVFAEMESKTYKPIRFESLQVDQINNRFVITGFAATQTDIAKFMLGLRTSPHILATNLRTSSAQLSEQSGYTFSIDVTFDPKLLRR